MDGWTTAWRFCAHHRLWFLLHLCTTHHALPPAARTHALLPRTHARARTHARLRTHARTHAVLTAARARSFSLAVVVGADAVLCSACIILPRSVVLPPVAAALP